MTELIATTRLSKAVPFVLQAAVVVIVVALVDVLAVVRLLNGSARPLLILGSIGLTVFIARFAFGQALVLYRAVTPSHAALWIEGDRLVYLSPLYSSLPLKDLGALDLQVLKRGFGNQPYGVITNGNGRKMFVHLALLNEPLEHVKGRLERLVRA